MLRTRLSHTCRHRRSRRRQRPRAALSREAAAERNDVKLRRTGVLRVLARRARAARHVCRVHVVAGATRRTRHVLAVAVRDRRRRRGARIDLHAADQRTLRYWRA